MDDSAMPEWKRILEGGWASAGDEEDAPAPVVETALPAAPIEEENEEMEDVATHDDANELIAAVKERMVPSKYHEFLTAISSSTVNSEAALALLAGHDDLIASFETCFAPSLTTQVATEPAATLEADDVEPSERRGPKARASQLVNLVFANKAGRPAERAKMLQYVKARSENPSFPRRLFILRGTAGAGGAAWAMEALRKEVDIRGNAVAAQYAHVCATDDFFTSFVGMGGAQVKYNFDPRKLEANNTANEARVRLAMEIGLEPLYIANPCMKLWDMRAYVLLADRLGYQVTVVSPEEICPAWNDLDFLTSRSEEKLGKAALKALIAEYEDLPSGGDSRPAIREAKKIETGEADGAPKVLAPSSMMYKLEKLMLEGSSLMRYTPPDGKGWGVNGELDGDWHSFRALSDDSCTYEDSGNWRTEDGDAAWTFEGLTWLEDLRVQAFQLPEANLPTAVSHPGLFVSKGKAAAVPAPATPPQMAAPVDEEPANAAPAASVPSSRRERFKQRVRQQVEEAAKKEDEPVPPPPKKPRTAGGPQPPRSAPPKMATVDADAYQPPPGMPSESEEMSAATFLAAVKARLLDWGKVELYHEFVVALSGSVDAKAAVRILRGHDDLLAVFRRKFAPRSDLMSIKQELDEENPQDAPHAPGMAPLGRGAPAKSFVKTELGGPRPPPGRPMVKSELGARVKGEIKSENMPRPPAYDPNSKRVVSVGDDSDEDVIDDASIAAAVKKGRDECIAELAKLIFRKERASREGVRQRFDMVRYATRRAAKPRFPRELYILRGPPGMGKTDYAYQQLTDHVDVETGEELGARLTHVCATDDFFELFKGDAPEYKFEARKFETHKLRNQARVRLAMEAGIHPLFVDEPNMRLWEMRPYVTLAEKLGYVVTIVEPSDISEKWDDVDFLTPANDTTERRDMGKVVSRGMLKALVDVFEPVAGHADPVGAVRVAKQAGAPAIVQAADGDRPSKTNASGAPAKKGGSKIPAYSSKQVKKQVK